jgi:hypothetical protein
MTAEVAWLHVCSNIHFEAAALQPRHPGARAPLALVVIQIPQKFLATPNASPSRSQMYTTGKLSLAIYATMSYSSQCRFHASL